MRAFGVIGWSGSGKTTLIERLVAHLTATGIRVSTVKHAHHGFDLDRPGKDSHRHRSAGATEVLTVSDQRWFLQHEFRADDPPSLGSMLRRLDPVDLVLVEGFKSDPLPKIEMIRPSADRPPRFPDDPTILALALVEGDPPPGGSPRGFRADDIGPIADFVLDRAAPVGEIA